MKRDPIFFRLVTDHRAFTTVVTLVTLAPFLLGTSPTYGETRGYVISWFATATNNPDFEVNCPRAFKDPNSRFRALGAGEGAHATTGKRRIDRAFVDGKAVAPYDFPDALQEDPDIETVVGKYAYGFDLGGSEANKFIDPETHERVDNQVWRAVGCTTNFQFTPPAMPYMEGQAWTSGYADGAPAWTMQISGADLSRDGPVTVTLDRALHHLQRDALGGIRSDFSYVIDPNPRSHNVLRGEIKNGLLWIKSGDIYLEGSLPYYMQVDLQDAHMRISSEPEGKLVGYWGGYTDWHKWAYMYTSRCGGGFDCIGIYRSVEKLADYDADPVSGRNRKISIAWRMEAVPAFLASEAGKILASASSEALGGQVHETGASNGEAKTAANNVH